MAAEQKTSANAIISSKGLKKKSSKTTASTKKYPWSDQPKPKEEIGFLDTFKKDNKAKKANIKKNTEKVSSFVDQQNIANMLAPEDPLQSILNPAVKIQKTLKSAANVPVKQEFEKLEDKETEVVNYIKSKPIDYNLIDEQYNNEINNSQAIDNIREGAKGFFNEMVLGPVSMVGQSIGADIDLTISPYKPLEKEKKEAIAILSRGKKKGQKISNADIDAVAKDIFYKEKILIQQGKTAEEYWDSQPLYIPEVAAQKEKLKIRAAQDVLVSSDLARQQTILAKTYNNELAAFEKYSNEFKAKYTAGNVTDEEIAKYGVRQEDAKKAVESLKGVYDNFPKYIDKIKSDGEKLEYFKYNYDDVTANMSRLVGTGINILGGTTKILGSTVEYIEGDKAGLGGLLGEIGEANIKMGNRIKEDVKNISFDDVTSFADFGKYSAALLSEQLPVYASMYFGGNYGAAAVSLGSGGQKIQEMEDEIGSDYDLGTKLLAGYGFALAEFVPEKLGTLRMFDNMKRVMSSVGNQPRQIFKENFIKSSLKTAGIVSIESQIEGGTEVLTEGLDMLLDEHLLGKTVASSERSKRFKEAYAGGAFMGGGMQLGGGVSTLVVKELKNYATAQEMAASKNIMDRIDFLQTELQTNTKLSGKESEEIVSEIKTLSNESVKVIENSEDRVYDMSTEDMTTVLDINRKQQDLKNSYIELSQSNFSPEIKKDKAAELKNEFSRLESEREFLLTGQYAEINKIIGNRAVINSNVNNIKKIVAGLGEEEISNRIGKQGSIAVFETTDELKKAYKQWLVTENESVKKAILNGELPANTEIKSDDQINEEVEKGAETDGFALPNGQSVINLSVASRYGAINVAQHEFLHKVLGKVLSNPIERKKVVNGFLSVLTANERAIVQKRIDENYIDKKTGKLKDEDLEEYFTAFIDAIAYGQIGDKNQVKDILRRAARPILKVLRKLGFSNAKFSEGRDFYDFLKEYQSNASKGRISNRAKELLAGKQIPTTIKYSKSIEERMDALDDQLYEGEIDYDTYENKMLALEKEEADLKRKVVEEVKVEKKPEVKKKVAIDAEAEIKELIADSKGSISSDKVQQIYNEKGVEGALDIIKLFGPITKKIVDKRRDAPGFDRELLTDEIETGVGGILDLISKYDPKSGTPLAAYINKYLPVRAITASRRVLDKDFKKDAAEEKGLMATETADSGFVESAKEKPKYKNALESKIFTPEELKTAENKILTVVRTLKNRIDAPISINRTVTPIIAEIRDAIGKQLDIDLKTIMGGKKDGVLRKWLLDHKRYVLENMTTTWLMGADGKGGIPQAIQKKIDGKWVNYPDWVGKKIDREAMSTDNAGRTSGAELARRLPNVFNNVSDADYLGQILEVDGNPIRGRKESLAKAVAEESSFDIITNDLLNEGPIFDALATNQERLGYELLSNSVNEVIKQAERGNVKFSKNLLVELDAKKDLLASNISINGRPSLRNIKAAIGITFPKWNGEEITNVANALMPNLTLAFKQARQTKRTKPVDLFTKAISNVANDLDTGTIMSIKFGSPMSVARFFRTPEMVADLKTMDRNFSIAVIKKFGEKSGFDLLNSLWKPTVAGKTSAGAISIYKGVDDFTNNLESIKKELNYEGEITSNNKKANKVFKNHFDGTYDYKKDKQKSEAAWELGTFAAEWFSNEINNPENNYGAQHLAALYTLLIKENDSVLRSAAPVSGVITDKRIKELNKYDYDHSKPVSYVARRLADKFVYNKEVDLDLLKKDYEVNIIPKTVSSKLTRSGLKSMMPLDYTEGAGSYLRISQATATVVDKYEKFAETVNKNEQNLSNALMKQSFSKAQKGISVFDFDDTTGITKGNVLYTMSDGTTGKLNAEEFAKEGSRLLAEGAEFDFSEFSKVVDGKPGPMVEKMKKMIGKFGPENFFILTARPQAAAVPIQEFLSSIDINIPLENITGLGNSTGQAKADWIVEKAAEGYNDFYFADDAIQNVTAVKDALDVLDVKAKIQQAKIKFSKSMSDEFNKIIEENKGVESYKVYSDIVAKRRGAGKNRFDLFVPPSAADFELLLYKFMGKGKRGEEQQKFFDEALLKPYINGVNLMDGARQSIKKSYKALTKAFPDVQKKLEKLSPDKDFTYDQAIRVALWNDAGIKIPGLTQRDNKKLVEMVNGDPELLAFKEGLKAMSRQEKGWVEPSEYWDTDTIVSDLFNITQSGGRKKFLGEFIENVETIFGKWEAGKLVGPNMNKIQAVYGTNVREALEDSLYRMINGKNRSYGQDRETSMWTNWVTGSTGVIMFLNTRSAVLQLLSTANFLNLRDNNPIAAAKAFANQKQYWSDFATIWNSDKMKERRGGLREDVVASEIANAAAGSKNKAAAVISYLLKIGYTPTQLADSFAISSGGAPYYRNRIKTHISEGMSETEAETLAWEEFSKIADETQQSGDPKDISKQQASGAGRLLLTFQNTAMQQSRLVKKAFLDLKNGRGDVKTNIAKISYYLVIQNTIFSVLQQGLFSVLFDEDEEEAKRNKSKDEKAVDLANGVLDSILRGTGFYGGIAATLKNVAVKYMEQQDKKQKDYAAVVIEAANISPPIGSKLRKLYAGLKQTEYDKDLIKERGWGIMQDGRVHLGPMYSVTGKGAEVLLNVPMDRLVNKIENVSQALNNQNKAWQRAAVALGFTPWTVGIEKPAGDLKIIEEAKAKRKIEGLAKAEITRKEKSKALKDSIKSLTPSERLKYRRSVALEKREIALAKRKKRKMGGD